MKLNETVMIRNYLQILKENEEEARFDKEKMETIQDIARKHSNTISYTQMLGVLDIDFGSSSNVDEDRIDSFIQKIDNANIELYDDTGPASRVIENLGGFGINNLNPEQKKVFIYLTGVGSNVERTPHINPEIVQKTVLKSFKSDELKADEFLMLVSNMRSRSGDTVRSAPSAVKNALEKVGVEIDTSLMKNQKEKSMGAMSSTRVKHSMRNEPPLPKIKDNFLRSLTGNDKELSDKARQTFLNILSNRETVILAATLAVNDRVGYQKYSAEQLINFPIFNSRVGKRTYPGLREINPELVSEMMTDFKDYNKHGVILWTSITKEQSDILQSGYAKSKQSIPKTLAALGIEPHPSMR